MRNISVYGHMSNPNDRKSRVNFRRRQFLRPAATNVKMVLGKNVHLFSLKRDHEKLARFIFAWVIDVWNYFDGNCRWWGVGFFPQPATILKTFSRHKAISIVTKDFIIIFLKRFKFLTCIIIIKRHSALAWYYKPCRLQLDMNWLKTERQVC